MNLYRIEYKPLITNRDSTGRPLDSNQRSATTQVSWHGTATEMRHTKTGLKKAKAEIATAEPTEVPTDKAGLLAWLNECCGVRQ